MDSTPVYWTTPTVVSLSGSNPTIESNYQPGNSFAPGTTAVTYTAKDDKNNTAECSFSVKVVLPYMVTNSEGLNSVLKEWTKVPNVDGLILFNQSNTAYQLDEWIDFDYYYESVGSLTLNASGASNVTLLAPYEDHHFWIKGGANLTIVGLTLVGGSSTTGGSIKVEDGAVLTAISTTFKGNRAYYGGAIGMASSDAGHPAIVNVIDSEFFENTGAYGGAISLFGDNTYFSAIRYLKQPCPLCFLSLYPGSLEILNPPPPYP